MVIDDDKIGDLKKFIGNSLTGEFSNSYLENQSNLLCRLLDSHYFATILFPNRHSNRIYYFSNNPDEFNQVYLPLQDRDVLQDAMINTKTPVTYRQINRQDIPGKRDFFEPIQKIRPVSDCMYIPFTLDDRLCGFTAIAREGASSPTYGREDLKTFDFLSSYIKEIFIRSFSLPAPEENQGYLDREGHVIGCGRSAKDIFTDLFGDKHWDSPLASGHALGGAIKRAFHSVLYDLPGSHGTVKLNHGGKEYRLEMKRHTKIGTTHLPSGVPAVEIRLKRVADRKLSLIDYDNFVKKYELTPREKELVDCIYRGMNNQAISEHLKISLSTVKKHVWNIYNKVGVDSRTGLIFALSL